MSFPPPSLRIAGQDSDIPFPFPEVPWCPQMYGTNESIKSWIDAIDCGKKSAFDLGDSDHTDVFEFATHPFRVCRPHSPFSLDSDVSFCFAASAWAPEIVGSTYYDDSDESRSESSSDDAQYIDIPFDSPWYRRPSPSPGPISAHELSTAAYALSCSNDVRQAIAQQELLLAVFHKELHRIVPRPDGTAHDSDWLEGMDADLVLSPLEAYADLCWESAVCDKSTTSWPDRPVPDVPMGPDDIWRVY